MLPFTHFFYIDIMKQFRILYLILLIFITRICFASNSYDFKDSVLAQKLSDLAWSLKDENPDSSFHLASRALEIAQNRNLKKLEAYSLSDIGNYFKRKEDYKKAKKYYNNSLKVRHTLSDSVDIASGFNLLGILYNQQGEYDTSLIYFKKGLSWLSAEKKHRRLHVKIIDGIATSYLNCGLYEEAQSFLVLCIEDATELNDSIILAKCWQNQGVFYERIGRSEISLEYYTKAESVYRTRKMRNLLIDILINKGVTYLHRNDFQKAITLLLESEELSVKYKFNDNLSSIYNNLGLCYQGVEEYKLSEQQFRKGIDYAVKLNKPQKRIETSLNLIRLMRTRGQIEKVIILSEELEPLIKQNGVLNYIIAFYDHFAWAFGEQKEYEKAYRIKSKVYHLKDSLNKIIDNAQLKASQLERLTKEKEIIKQQTKLKESLLQEKIYRQQLYLTITLALVFVLALTTFIFYLKRRNSSQKLLLLESDKKISFEREEAEKVIRREISKELHDHMTRELSLVHMKMDDIIDRIPELSDEIKSDYMKVGELLEVYYQHVRQIAHKLNQAFMSEKLETRIEQLIDQVNSTGKLMTHLSMDKIPKTLTLIIEKEVFGIISLAIDNIVRHSKASEVSVQFYMEDNFLHLSIEDDGIGFDIGNHDSNGIGLSNIRERAKNLNANLIIETSENQGTLIMLKIPLNKT